MIPTPVDSFSGLLALSSVIDPNSMLEKRMINSSSGQIQYLGWTPLANASTSTAVWMIVKLSYDSNGFLNYYQLPNAGNGFIYIWNNYASYF